jgi:hypothetical protein
MTGEAWCAEAPWVPTNGDGSRRLPHSAGRLRKAPANDDTFKAPLVSRLPIPASLLELINIPSIAPAHTRSRLPPAPLAHQGISALATIMPSADIKPRTLYDKVFQDHIVNEREDGTILLYIGMVARHFVFVV